MPDYVFDPPPQAALAVAGSDARFPVRRVFCVGRNYADHAREMGHDPDREPPFFFTKPADAVTGAGSVPYPPLTADLHHEVELVVALGAGGADLDEAASSAAIWGWAVGIDLTRRDLQAEAKAMARPWCWAKAFDASAPCGPLLPAAGSDWRPDRGAISLAVNGETRQEGDLAQMIWRVPEIIAAASRAVALRPGDVIFTGTPAGVGPAVRGDRLAARIEGLPPLDIVLA